ncbi:Polyketide cyclase / dehydrase and lipid transport [Amycolatopsis pretoriensis]|uniref:Polyketide cyclase / dehydrase and lipid transport n=1 Tax=Amycolatopsis pretoriensis TaxID=218821 RepID=A0A1H5R3G1_9PSEU|nr:SRPBCC family protein [Amycolatopsis pretoriensis]SEF32584.1 Polyketide cyclase / dehydrase and lipid transport [Amycolatopsis pretoriensis]
MVQRISVRRVTAADADTVYALLRDGASWPRWSPLGSFELVRAGVDEPEGLGALRLFRTGGIRSYEEVVALEPGRRFGYALDHGLPLRDYVAYVDLAPVDGGTEIHWHSSFTAKVPGTGWFYRRFLARFIGRVVAGLAEAAPVAP